MHGPFDARSPLVSLADEVIRLNGRLRSTFAASRRGTELSDSEMMVLNAVVEAERPPTVPQIGRSLGQARQLIQRATNALLEDGLVEAMANPDHKRAPLFRATDAGFALKRRIDAEAEGISARLGDGVDLETARDAAVLLRRLRKQLEARLRAGDL